MKNVIDELNRLKENVYEDFGGENARYAYETAISLIEKECSRPAHPAPPQFNSTELLLLAHDEWKRRQERKHLDDEAAWVSGFIGGFITDKNWARDKVDNLIIAQEQP
jgi:hypothetical protein